VDARLRRRIIRELAERSPWPDEQFTAAVGALAAENTVGASAAESALERTDPRFNRIRRKILVATLAAGTQFKHRSMFPVDPW
jgi:hypothetical protein